MNNIPVKINRAEALRYLAAGGSTPDENLTALMDICEEKLIAAVKGKYIYRVFDISDNNGERVVLDGCTLEMTGKEFELLTLLIENKGRTLSKELIFSKIWGGDSFSEPQTLTVHINRLRQKLEEDPKKPRRIVTVWGVGYKFEVL